MTFRTRLLLGFAVTALLPLALLAAGVRTELGERVSAQHAARVAALSRIIERDLGREEAGIALKLKALTGSMADDDRLRLALVHGAAAERRYLLDYASRAMRLAGLDVLLIHDERGRIMSSGHFRNDFDRLDPRIPNALARLQGGGALATLRAPDGPFLALLRLDTLILGQRHFRLVGGVKVDSALLARFASDAMLRVTLVTPDDSGRVASSGGSVAAELSMPFVSDGDAFPAEPAVAHVLIVQTGDELAAVRRSVDRWFAFAMALMALTALVLGAWLSARLSRPLAELADATSRIGLEGPEVELATGRDDEIGVVARRLTTMSRRLRAGAARLRDAERRATVGDMARQVNHDIKNGLVPIRNVLRHLTQVQQQSPELLAGIFAERRQTLESSVGYLDTLARRYAMLTPRVDQRPFDLESVAADVARSASLGGTQVELQLTQPLPRVHGDPIVLRRILENLCRNALESLTDADGKVTLRAAPVGGGVRISVIDTGRGLSEAELGRAFDDFYTTKAGGTGLGLSVVRRLANDLGGTMRISSSPGAGTSVSIDLPASSVRSRAPAPDQLLRIPIPESRFPKS
ncbi:MAG TPA: HAMP domain-containing sensor histidine kinase [Gemmatimonadaceae bacterium]|nr:HAMP domain-containing sensor histidine kinase [Gemmatimonadaceae bacterium]